MLLMIFEMHPEEVLFYYFDKQAQEDIKKEYGETFFEDVNGVYINGADHSQELMDRLYNFAFNEEGYNKLEKQGVYLKCSELPFVGQKGIQFDKVVHCGFFI